MNSTIAGDHRAGVLVVDDEPDVRKALSDMLEHEGYVVHSVGTGAAAVQQAAQFSPAYEQIWGRTCQTLYAAPASWLDAVHPEDRERIGRAVETKQVKGEYCEEYRIVRPDGRTHWILDRAFPILDESGTVYRLAGIAECITAQKIADQRLAAQYAVARALAESATLTEATPKILQAICESLGWDIGAIWLIDEQAEALRCVHVWHSPRGQNDELRSVELADRLSARRRTAGPGLGVR